jgi:hypothetical protein
MRELLTILNELGASKGAVGFRKVSTNGGIRWHSAWVNVSHLLGGELIGLDEVADGVWAVHFGPVALGSLHVRRGVILDHDGSSSRNPRR